MIRTSGTRGDRPQGQHVCLADRTPPSSLHLALHERSVSCQCLAFAGPRIESIQGASVQLESICESILEPIQNRFLNRLRLNRFKMKWGQTEPERRVQRQLPCGSTLLNQPGGQEHRTFRLHCKTEGNNLHSECNSELKMWFKM
eukprot:2496017-Rhodomonas_salina.1